MYHSTRKKTVYANTTAIFAGYEISADGFRPHPELARTIREFPRPSNVTDLRSFYGLCQQVGNFSDKIAAASAPLSPLLKKISPGSGPPIMNKHSAPPAVH
jgi:hypothetical protein